MRSEQKHCFGYSQIALPSIRNYHNCSGNCTINYKKGGETSFVSHIVYASMRSVLYLSEILFTKSASKIGIVCNLLVYM